MIEIRNIIEAYDAIDHENEKVALASVVTVEESSYRRIGARMLVTSEGRWVGGISGGCLEGDALKKSQHTMFHQKHSLVTYDTMDDEANEIGVGLGCNGRIGVLFTPISKENPENEIEQLRIISGSIKPSVLLKIIETEGSDDLLGKIKMVGPSESIVDFAGIKDIDLNSEIKEVFQKRKSSIVEMFSTMSQKVKILIEFIRPEIQIILVGDNYDMHAMTESIQAMGWEMTIVGRPKKLSKKVFGNVKAVIHFDHLDQLIVHQYTAVVLMAHDYKRDKEMLEFFVKKRPAYLGILGPKKRFQKMKHELSHINFNLLNFIYSPAGLEIGAETPQEISLSIISEIIAVLRQKSGGSLREKQGAIHDRHE
jgi:xanthine/CO dehydrogenase XdhC/CoxF family maturation factor